MIDKMFFVKYHCKYKEFSNWV